MSAGNATNRIPVGVLIAEKIKSNLDLILGSGWSLCEKKTECSYDDKLPIGKWELHSATRAPIASFELYPMINCCGICVSTAAHVEYEYQNKGLGTLLNQIRIDIARANGYGLLLCTDVESNEYQRKILKKNGWKDIHKFLNPRTQNSVYISVIGL